jgi:hypothetical protein
MAAIPLSKQEEEKAKRRRGFEELHAHKTRWYVVFPYDSLALERIHDLRQAGAVRVIAKYGTRLGCITNAPDNILKLPWVDHIQEIERRTRARTLLDMFEATKTISKWEVNLPSPTAVSEFFEICSHSYDLVTGCQAKWKEGCGGRPYYSAEGTIRRVTPEHALILGKIQEKYKIEPDLLALGERKIILDETGHYKSVYPDQYKT